MPATKTKPAPAPTRSPRSRQRKTPTHDTAGNLRATVRIENNKRRAVCLACGEPIPAYAGTRVDDAATGDVRGYRHPSCPEPKHKRPRSPKRDPHALGKHVLRKRKDGTRVCGVKGCHYREYFDATAGDWLQVPATYEGARAYASRDPEPSLINMELWG